MDHPVTHKPLLESVVGNFFAAHPEVHFTSDLEWTDQGLEASFQLPAGVSNLDFELKIPPDYPLGRMIITCEARRNTAHCLENGMVCFVPAFCPDPAEQLKEDWECFTRWLDEFVVQGKPELRYAYPTLPSAPIYMIFSEESRVKPLRKGDCGSFSYAQMYDLWGTTTNSLPTGIAFDVGGEKANWAKRFQKVTKFEGLWLYIENEPRDYEGNLITHNNQLDSILTSRIKKKIDEFRKRLGHDFNGVFPAHFPLMIGYEITNDDLREIHWEMMLLPVIPQDELDSRLKLLEKLGLQFPKVEEPLPVAWGRTLNASYARFFGRGKLSQNLCDSRILVIGVGAIGGTLTDMLVRGGCRHISISDQDYIQPGNVCRSVYPFGAVNRMKVDYLSVHLQRLSPYVEVNRIAWFPVVEKASPSFVELQAAVNHYDIVFDCSANNRVAWMLDQLDTSAMVLNLSVTDAAQEFLMVSGAGKILDKKESWLRQLGSVAEPSYYEGIGCWSPTFRASIADLNAPLALGLSRIDASLKKNLRPESFVLRRTPEFGIEEVKMD